MMGKYKDAKAFNFAKGFAGKVKKQGPKAF